MRRYLPFLVIGAVFLIAIGSGLVLWQAKQPSSAPVAPIPPVVPSAPKEAPGTPEPKSLHVRGGANAPVTVEEFGDFQCRPCAKLAPTLLKLEEHYGERLRVIFRHKPLRPHEHAVIAACAAEAAGLQGRFWEMHDLLFENWARWQRGVDTIGPEASPSRRLQSNVLALDAEVREVFIKYAEWLKLDLERFKTDIDSAEVKARIESDRLHANSLGIDRTPTIYLNGRILDVSRHGLEAFQAAIEAELTGKGEEKTASSPPGATPEQPK
ncbi:MAG TPA: thioredoxin domain-containing protein [Chthoniobacterales bacterium]|nr:thioredoxin domain-containing protein [Chthoniobacterales bacterium]